MIEVHDALLQPTLLNTLAAQLANARFVYGHRSSKSLGYAHWNHNIVRQTGRNISPICIPEAYKQFWAAIKPQLPLGSFPIRLYANLHTFGTEGSPHTDSNRLHETTIVVYINREWKREWGGETTFYVGDEITRAVAPKFGRVVIFPSNMWHCARAVSRICPEARITLVLKTRSTVGDAELQQLESFLALHGAQAVKHSGDTLYGHLVRTYEILRAKGAPLHVCLGGGLHSVYGTNKFKHKLIQNRKVVEAEFGADAEALAYRFSQLDRPAIWEHTVTCGLHLIECANLIDQGVLGKNKHLAQVWRDYRGQDGTV